MVQRKSKGTFLIYCCILSAALAVGWDVIFSVHHSAAALESEKRLEPTPLVKRMDYYVREGGKWLAKNPEFKAGAGQDTHYGYEFSWMMGKTAGRVIIFGLQEDGSRRDYHECIYVWNPQEKKVQMFQFTFFGGYGGGMQEEINDTTSETVITWNLPNGKEYVFKDVSIRKSANEFENKSYEKDEKGEWRQKGGFLWQRQPGP